jgi:hypothetical protein
LDVLRATTRPSSVASQLQRAQAGELYYALSISAGTSRSVLLPKRHDYKHRFSQFFDLPWPSLKLEYPSVKYHRCDAQATLGFGSRAQHQGR